MTAHTTFAPLTEALAGMRPGDPISYRDVTLVPLFTTHQGRTTYTLLEDALAAGLVKITETGPEGEVPFLAAHNRGPQPVLIYDGEELVGAKQNRIVNTTVLLGVGRTVLPVSCVEAGRWHSRSEAFAAGLGTSHPELRRLKHAHVARSLKNSALDPGQAAPAARYRSDQGRIWDEVAERTARLGVESPTEAMTDAYAYRGFDVEELVAGLAARLQRSGPRPSEAGPTGLAAFVGGRFACLDYLAPAAAFTRLTPKLLRGYALEALAPTDAVPDASEDPEAVVLRLLAGLGTATFESNPGVGVGEDVRMSADGYVGAGLTVDGELVQLTVFPSL